MAGLGGGLLVEIATLMDERRESGWLGLEPAKQALAGYGSGEGPSMLKSVREGETPGNNRRERWSRGEATRARRGETMITREWAYLRRRPLLPICSGGRNRQKADRDDVATDVRGGL